MATVPMWEEAVNEIERLRAEVERLTRERDAAVALLRSVFAKLDSGRDAPGHSHLNAGIWDSDNDYAPGPPCEWCATWARVNALAKGEGK